MRNAKTCLIMKVLLFGSIASGKTTIAKLIKKEYSYFEIISIDNFRKEFGDYTMEGEKAAQTEFLNAIKQSKNQIIEASGLGKLGFEIYNKLEEFNDEILLVILHIPVEEINARIKNRSWDIPFPGKQEKLENIIQTINFGILFGKIPMIWSELNRTTIFQIENDNLKTQTYILKTIVNLIKLKLL